VEVGWGGGGGGE
jgi:hypothetical protein